MFRNGQNLRKEILELLRASTWLLEELQVGEPLLPLRGATCVLLPLPLRGDAPSVLLRLLLPGCCLAFKTLNPNFKKINRNLRSCLDLAAGGAAGARK
jgi:hypothetical protein